MRYLANLHPTKLGLYGVLSIADLYCTYVLVQQSNGGAYEANPIAAAWLTWFGWKGLVTFKALMVFVVAIVVAVISAYRPQAGAFVLKVACTALVGVVIYSWSVMHVVAGDIARANKQMGACSHIQRVRHGAAKRILTLDDAPSVNAAWVDASPSLDPAESPAARRVPWVHRRVGVP
jgi:Domain of unknown function (DUF5658)